MSDCLEVLNMIKMLQPLLTYFIAFQFKKLKLHRDSVLTWSDHLPHTVFVWWVFFGPARGGYGAIELCKKPSTSS